MNLPRLLQIVAPLALPAFVLGCGSGPDILPATGVVRADPQTCVEGSRADRVLAASWNMAIGFDVTDLLFLNPDSIRAIHDRALKIHSDAVGNLPRLRVRLMAEEIVRTAPEIVGLQETMHMVWNGALVADFLDTLMADLNSLGANYTLYASPLNEATLHIPDTTGGSDSIVFEFHEGNAVLVSPRWNVVGSGTIHYRNVIPVDLLGLKTVTDRAAQWLQLQDSSGFKLEVWNTHLEVLDAQTIGQAGEFTLFADSLRAVQLASGFKPSGRLFLGDINSQPGSTAANLFLQSHWNDAWDSTRFGTGATYGSGSLRDPNRVLTERLDRILHQGGCGIDTAFVHGNAAFPTDSGPLFPSDHGLVVAKLRYGIRP